MDRSQMKLGKGPVKHDPRTLKLGEYLLPAKLPTPPKSIDYSTNVRQWRLFQNDKIGDCTCASLGNLLMLWTATAGRPFAPTDRQIVDAYSAITGYDPGTGDNDNGAVELDVLNYARSKGIAGHKIEAYVSVKPSSQSHVKSSIHLFEGCYLGLALPVSAQDQDVWDVPAGGARGKGKPGSWGGHAVPVVGYDADTLTCVTWGQTLKMTWKFFRTYCEEAYALLSTDMLSGGKCPAGFDVQALRRDLAAL